MLDLNGNDFVTFPDVVTQMDKLSYLDLGSNINLESLPSSIANMDQLRVLYV